MPSGAKKRKAAKKKKEKEANSSTHSPGEGDLKIHNEKESDGSEASSPASQEHHNHQHPFTGGEENEVEKREDTSSARLFVSENNSEEGLIDRNSKPDDESERKDTSSSSSDDESLVVEKNIVVVEPDDQMEKNVSLLSDVETHITASVPDKEAEKSVVAAVLEDKVSSPLEAVQAIESVSPQNSATIVVVESDWKAKVEENFQPIAEDLKSEEKEDKVVSISEKSASVSSDSAGLVVKESEEKLLVSSNAPRVDYSNGAEDVKEIEIPECSGSRPLVASDPGPVETTSWKSCCGLFDVLKASN